jgi:tRNA A37 threonylcarbamoyladenosine dehydratase
VIDAIDSLPNKLDLIEASYIALTSKDETKAKLFSSMGMAWKMDPTRIKIGSIWETHDCPLARLVRQGLRKRGFEGDFTVVYSDEQTQQADNIISEDSTDSKKVKGSAVTVTASAGMILASLVLRDIMGQMSDKQVTNG